MITEEILRKISGGKPSIGELPGVGMPVSSKKKTPEEIYNIQELNDQAKSAFFRKKMAEALAKKNPEAWSKISSAWAELSKDPVSHTAQVRQRASFDVDKGQTKLSQEELKQLLGKDFDEFMRLREKYSSFNQGLQKNSAATMAEFGFDDLAPTIQGGTFEDIMSGKYYKPEYDESGELYVDTNIPELSHLIRKKAKAQQAALAKQ